MHVDGVDALIGVVVVIVDAFFKTHAGGINGNFVLVMRFDDDAVGHGDIAE